VREHRALSREFAERERATPDECTRANSKDRDERGIDLGIGL
jgi:hypothetical protein